MKQSLAHFIDPTPRLYAVHSRLSAHVALVPAVHPSKNFAADLNISQRTVENHRAAIMRRTGAASLAALVRLSLGESDPTGVTL